MHELATALHKNSTLKHLHLDHNHTGVEGASSMSDMILQNTSLKELHLKDYSIGEEGVHRLFSSLKHNQTLEKLWLPNCKSEISHHKICWLCEYFFAVFKFFFCVVTPVLYSISWSPMYHLLLYILYNYVTFKTNRPLTQRGWSCNTAVLVSLYICLNCSDMFWQI